MCAVSYGVEALKYTDTGSTLVILPWRSVYPAGEFIHEFAATTDMAPSTPATTIGTPLHQCAQGGSRRHPYRYTPTKIASRNKKIPSSHNPKPTPAPTPRADPHHDPRPAQPTHMPPPAPPPRPPPHHHRHDLRPAARQQQRRGIAAPDTDLFRGQGDGRERDAEARQDDVEPQRRPHLRPGRHRIHGQNVRHCAHCAPPSAACHHRAAKPPPMCTATALRVGRGGYPATYPRAAPGI